MKKKIRAFRRFYRNRIIQRRIRGISIVPPGKLAKNKPAKGFNPRREFKGKTKLSLTLQELKAIQREKDFCYLSD
jgi:hypothetical protein